MSTGSRRNPPRGAKVDLEYDVVNNVGLAKRSKLKPRTKRKTKTPRKMAVNVGQWTVTPSHDESPSLFNSQKDGSLDKFISFTGNMANENEYVELQPDEASEFQDNSEMASFRVRS